MCGTRVKSGSARLGDSQDRTVAIARPREPAVPPDLRDRHIRGLGVKPELEQFFVELTENARLVDVRQSAGAEGRFLRRIATQ